MIELAIFDMDGLLIDSEPFWREAQQIAFKTVGVDLTEDDMRTTMGRRIDEVVAHWHHERPWEGASQKDIEALIVDKVIELAQTKGVPRPGVIQTLDYFKSAKIPMVVASSSASEIINAVVDAIEIRDYFELLYSAEHETHGKPHPGVFITTAEKMNTPPHRCLVFEDSPSGVLAAKAAKMKCVAVPDEEHGDHPFINTADIILKSLEDYDHSAAEDGA